jgi:hypothetical protein
MANLSSISSLGTIDAETDFQVDFFVPSTSWESVRRREKPIAIGRKGTGKTALRYALRAEADSEPLVFATTLAFRDYPWAVHYSVFDSNVGGRSRYQETWIFLMLVELAKLAVGENQALPDLVEQRDVVQALRSFLRDTWGGITFDHRETFRRPRFKVAKATFAPTVVGTSLGSVDWTTVERETLGDALSGMNRWLKAALSYVIARESEYFLVFDELDLDFEKQNDTYMDSMIGLVLAAQNVHLWARENDVPTTPVVLMRDDIYSSLYFPDKNKITTNLVEQIYWTAEFTGANSLKGVIDKRIAVTLEAKSSDPWFLLFDEEVMRGTQHKYLHIAQRTYLRPRDIIYFVNQCISVARARGAVVDDKTRIANRDVTSARTAYSTYLRQELSDEIHAHYPQWESWLDILRRIGRLTFTRQVFDEECRRSSHLLKGAEPGEVLGALYRFGIVGFGKRGGGGRGGTYEYWSYQDPDTTFDPEASYFKVHLGLKENLDLKEERR